MLPCWRRRRTVSPRCSRRKRREARPLPPPMAGSPGNRRLPIHNEQNSCLEEGFAMRSGLTQLESPFCIHLWTLPYHDGWREWGSMPGEEAADSPPLRCSRWEAGYRSSSQNRKAWRSASAIEGRPLAGVPSAARSAAQTRIVDPESANRRAAGRGSLQSSRRPRGKRRRAAATAIQVLSAMGGDP